MREYSTEALVLDKEDSGEMDLRVHLFTESLGRITARATSARKITSKLAAHLEPLNFIQLRLVETKGFQIADAITVGRLTSENRKDVLDILLLAKDSLAFEHPDEELWKLLRSGSFQGREMLKILGFDPAFAKCFECGSKEPKNFLIRDAHYVCNSCVIRWRKGASTLTLESA